MRKSILITLAITLACACSNAQSLYVLSLKGNVNLRTAPSTSAPKAGTLKSDELLPWLDESDGWYKVDYNGKEAYVAQSVSAICEAVIPDGIYKKDLSSTRPLDKIRHSGTIRIDPIDNSHVLISVCWMRINLPAEMSSYLASVKDGKIVATHAAGTYIDPEAPLSDIQNEVFPLDKPIPLGFEEFNNTIYFDGAQYSEYE